MKVYFILDDTVFFYPQMLDKILSETKYSWVGVALSKKDPHTEYFKKHIFKIGFTSIVKLVLMKYGLKLYSALITPLTNVGVSLENVAKKHSIEYIYIDDINSDNFLSHIKSIKPDVIVSSNSQIFRKKLLSIPKIACINRHSSLLPSYGGILPVFHAIANGEKEIGVTIHIMDEGIDTGTVIAQEAIPIKRGQSSLFDLYKKCFDISPKLILEALCILNQGKLSNCITPKRPKSYYGFPTEEHWRLFKENRARFI